MIGLNYKTENDETKKSKIGKVTLAGHCNRFARKEPQVRDDHNLWSKHNKQGELCSP